MNIWAVGTTIWQEGEWSITDDGDVGFGLRWNGELLDWDFDNNAEKLRARIRSFERFAELKVSA